MFHERGAEATGQHEEWALVGLRLSILAGPTARAGAVPAAVIELAPLPT